MTTSDYGYYVRTSCAQTFQLLRRRRRTILAVLVAFLPVVVPLLVTFLSNAPFAPRGEEFFVQLIEKVYLRGTAPLLALFFACMLIGEDVEQHTLHYVLTRPVPRSAWVIGKFLGYWAMSLAILWPAMVACFGACTTLGEFRVTGDNLRLLAHYMGVIAAAMAVYGALSMCLGTFTKRPVIYGIIYLYGWQRLAITVPGVLDFTAIEKYLAALLPPLAIQRDNPALHAALLEFQKEEFVLSAWKAGAVLVAVTVIFVAITAVIVRQREFTAARAAGA